MYIRSLVDSYNGFFSNGGEDEMMMMVFFYDESFWRAIVTICGFKNHIISVLCLVSFCWVFVISDRECREVRPDFGYVLVGKP